MRLTAAPIVRKPLSEIGAPGMTDFVRIYIASELNKPEYRTTLRHEQGHVWSGHNRRRPRDAKHDVWAIACEMEIARTIYDKTDIRNVEAPRSRLAGGYLPNSIDGLPADVVLAEAIYDWLIENPDKQHPALKCCVCDDSDESEGLGEHAEVGKVVSDARQKIDADERERLSQIATDSVYASLKSRVPTLTCAVDAALRVRIERERSHRRPARRNADDSILLAGSISTPRPPLVEIFVDRSGSFSPQKTALAEIKLKELLSRYGSTIRSDVWFFGNGRLSDVDYGGGGDTPYHLIPRHLEKTKPKLAIIITDDDPVTADIPKLDKSTSILCVPIGSTRTNLASALNGVDVASS